ncbi:hypothetical protein [Streptomyces vastus]|uniref:hypothetical protein n=1 Tax=Streptomyces vastus TaxID=285451 RepID=UPI0031CF021C
MTRMKKALAAGVLAAGILAVTANPALAGSAPSFECEYVGPQYAHTMRKAPIREGMSRHAPIKVMVKKGQLIRYKYRCVSSKGTHWVKTSSPARGYLYRLHI